MNYEIKEWPHQNIEPGFVDLFKKWWSEDLINNPFYERYYILWKYADSVANLEGNFVECGSYNGSSAQFMANRCKTSLHLFDSWEGLPQLGEFDNPIYDSEDTPWADHRFNLELEAIQSNLARYSNITYHKGWIPDTLNVDFNVSLLHLDLDLYQSTKDALEYFWDKMVEGGVVISDWHDDVSWGAKKATIEFFDGLRHIDVLPTGKAIIIK